MPIHFFEWAYFLWTFYFLIESVAAILLPTVITGQRVYGLVTRSYFLMNDCCIVPSVV
jgi:hypothetical protein